VVCPLDSVIYHRQKEDCCRAYNCKCNKDHCEKIQPPPCSDGFERVMLKQGNGRPGSCCNMTVCRRQHTTSLCDYVCPKAPRSLLRTTDFLLVGTEESDDKCCQLGPIYKCLPCKYHCPCGYYPRLLERGTGSPGQCCHQYYCKKGECSTQTYIECSG
jgi:hypothetical protein